MESAVTEKKPKKLTNRELQVLTLLAKGKSNAEIGKELKISEHTAKTYIANVVRILESANRTEAVAKALRLQLIL